MSAFEKLSDAVEALGDDPFRWQDLLYRDFLTKGLRSAVRRGVGLPVDQARLESIWLEFVDSKHERRLANEEPLYSFSRSDIPAASTDADDVARRLARTARAMVACAGCAEASRRAIGSPTALGDVSRWAARAATTLSPAFPSDPVVLDRSAIVSFEGEEGVVLAAFDALASFDPVAAATARTWSLWLLESRRPQVRRPVLVRIAAAATSGEGRIVKLRCDPLPAGVAAEGGVLVEHPETALLPLDGDFITGLERAWRAAGQPAAVWSLLGVKPLVDGVQCGDSHTGASALAFAALERRLQLDDGLVVMAQLTEEIGAGDWRLGPIGGLDAKSRALVRVARRAIVHPDNESEVGDEIGTHAAGQACVVEVAETLETAIGLASPRQRPSEVAAGMKLPEEGRTPSIHFTGREGLIEELVAQLGPRNDGPAVVAVAGMPGVGKSELAAALAQRVASQYRVRFWIEMGGGRGEPLSAALAMRYVLERLLPDAIERLPRTVEELSPMYLDELRRVKERTGEGVLVVLDDAGSGTELKWLLPPESCGLLVTSRERLMVGGQQSTDVDTLDADASARLLRLQSGRKMVDEECAEIARLCYGLPQALVEVAGTLGSRRDIRPAEMAKRVRRELERLTKAGVAKELASVQAAFEASYALLGEREQTTLRRLAAFVPTFDRTAAIAVVGRLDSQGNGDSDDDEDGNDELIEEAIGELVRRKLVEYDEEAGRYWLHELVRVFAEGKCSSWGAEWMETRNRHAHYFASLLEALREQASGGDLADGVREFKREWSNIERGQVTASRIAGGNEAMARVCIQYAVSGQIMISLTHQIPTQKLALWLDIALAQASRLGDQPGLANTLQSLGDVERMSNAYDAAEASYLEALSLFEAIGSLGGQANTLLSLGKVELMRNNYDAAEARYLAALPLYEAIGYRGGRASTLRSLGDLERMRDGADAAEARYLEALPLFEAIGDRLGVANTLNSLGAVERMRCAYDAAEARYLEALPLYEAIGYRGGRASTLRSLGDIEQLRNRCNSAKARFLEALPLYEETVDRVGCANTLFSLGNVELMANADDAAEAHYLKALLLYEAIGDRLGRAHTLRALGDVEKRRDADDLAEARYLEALPLFEAIGSRLGMANTLYSLGEVELRRDAFDSAVSRFLEALPLYKAIGDRLGLANTFLSLGIVDIMCKAYDAAEAHYLEASLLYEAIGVRFGLATALFGLSGIQVLRGNFEVGEKSMHKVVSLCQSMRDANSEAMHSANFGVVLTEVGATDRAREWMLRAARLWEGLGARERAAALRSAVDELTA